jgi:hypothetical protein
VQRVLEADVRRGQLVDDARVEVVAPEVREPPDDDGLVVLGRHAWVLLVRGWETAVCKRRPPAGCEVG